MARQIIDLPEMNNSDLSTDDLFILRDKNQKKDKKMSLLSLVDFFYPIGQHWTNDLVNPNDRFPGTIWEKIDGMFVFSSDYEHPVGSTGGEKEHTLLTSEMPSHNHRNTTGQARFSLPGGSNNVFESQYSYNNGSAYYDYTNGRETSSVGGGLPHNNMPPYRTSVIWIRTA